MSTLKVNTIQNTSGGSSSTPEQIEQGRAKAWVHFKGTGTVSIYDDFNVSSITDNGTGHYRVNLSITMANIDYAAFADGRFNTSDGDGSANITLRRVAQTTTNFGVRCSDASANVYDPVFACAVIFGDQ